MMKLNILFASILASLALTACGGGSNSTDPATAASEPVAASAPVATTGAYNHPASAAVAASVPVASTPVASTGVNTTPVTSVPEPVTNKPVTSKTSIFYGVNGHNNEGGAYDISSAKTQLAQLQDLGLTVYRNEVYSASTAKHLGDIAPTFESGGVMVYPVMLMGLDAATDEASGYKAGYALGAATATAHKYPYYEVTNELEADCLVGNVDGVDGTDYDNAKFMKARGIILGMIDGVHSVDPNGKIVMGGGAWMHVAFDQMLFNGYQPDGTSGHTIPKWDVTAWHWYSDQGNILNACGGTGCYNILLTLQQTLGNKPIWLNEVGIRPNTYTAAQFDGYAKSASVVAALKDAATKYNVTSVQFYELYDDPAGGEGPYGLIQNDGKTQKPIYSVVKNFVAANPK